MTVSLVMAMVFVSGYYLGYQKAESGQVVDLDKTIVLALPKPAHADITEFEPFVPQVQMPGADIDVDSPEADAGINAYQDQATAQVNQAENQTETQVAAVIAETTNAIEAPAGAGIREHDQQDRQHQPLWYASLTTAVGESGLTDSVIVFESELDQQPDADNAQERAESVASDEQAGIMDSASAEDARYTIQVGVFADEANAIRRKTDLESQQLTAYINEYRNKRDQPRFNVRFGYFKDKSSARVALTRFQQDLSGSGYVTRIRSN